MLEFFKQMVRNEFKRKGYNIHMTPINPSNNEELLMMGLFKKYNIDMILDIGASRGQYVDSIRRMGYDRKFICFEPTKSAHTELEQKFKHDSMVKTYNVAIGNKDKDISINISKCDLCSSILNVSNTAIQIEPGTAHIMKEKCKMRKLDSFYNEFNKNIILKIDVQGFEKEVLMGATQTLKDASAVFIEISLVELYKGEASFSEIVNILEKKGFELFAITPAFMDNSNGRMLQVDGLFVKKEKLL